MRKSSRLCALCDTIIPDSHVVCKDHYEDYKLYKDEPWFKELSGSARRQFEIDNEQTAIQMGDVIKTTQSYRNLSESEKKLILEYYKKGLGSVNIGKLLGINNNTVEKFLQRVKNSSFK